MSQAAALNEAFVPGSMYGDATLVGSRTSVIIVISAYDDRTARNDGITRFVLLELANGSAIPRWSKRYAMNWRRL